ncbi:TVP38/TMEM64 family protein [Peptostreptococcus equinus]|uniref:TVP38/TMEM64 family membrane protein n=1 Tax=Peptostreptococcus equinus TaxID=3003601 RepID=A0ABY7JRN4_9FIRM|nr:TVP38/TMEM64 family protein [Peptostreptococcus sp. CBA3647]WAW15800.1 TVP38/TMEM64 family protein [Peptostreptococcus sp. CBA3647]
MNEKGKKISKIILIIAILLISVLFIREYSLTDIRDIINSHGSLGPLIYILLFIVLPIFFFPVPILVLAAGIAFGLEYGTFYTLIGSFFNALLMYYLGRFLGRDFVNNFLDKKVSRNIREKLQSDNQKTLTSVFFILRLVPLVSYNLINYVAGFTKIRLDRYLMTTVIGILPGLVVFLNAGDKSLNVKSPGFAIAILLLVILTLVSLIILKIYLRKENNGNNNSSNI